MKAKDAARTLGLISIFSMSPVNGNSMRCLESTPTAGWRTRHRSKSAFWGPGEMLGALSVRHRVPAISFRHDFVSAGGLMSYGALLSIICD